MDAFKSDRDLITEIAKQQKIDPEILLGPTPPVAEKLAAPKPVSPVYVMEAQAKTIETLLEKFRSAVEDIAELGKVLTTIKPLIVDVLTTLYADDVEALKIDRARSNPLNQVGKKSAIRINQIVIGLIKVANTFAIKAEIRIFAHDVTCRELGKLCLVKRLNGGKTRSTASLGG